MNLIGLRKKFYLLSLIIIAAGLVSLIARGLNLGIDFKSGTILEFDLHSAFTTGEVRELLNNAGLQQEPVIRAVRESTVVQIETEMLNQEQLDEIRSVLKEQYPQLELVRTDQVDPIFGRELARQALLALLVAAVGMIIYISWRFEFRFAITAIIALLHDVFVVLAVFSLLQIEVNVGFVAALLTIIGYSINDTIVIFDRIRENLRKRARRDALSEVVNRSLLETMRRSINTSLTTLMAVGAVLLLGGETLKPVALALFVGLISGTYSSIFIASPLWVDWKSRSAA